MSLSLRAVSGPLKDQIFPLSDGLTVGRQGKIALVDQKVSSLHARIELRPDGVFELHDNNSKNGIRVGTDRAARVELVKGAQFTIGDSTFEVVEAVEAPPPPTPKPSKKQRYWYEVLADFMGSVADDFEDKLKPLSPLEPALVLDFARGVQANTRWVLGFGPRKIGPGSVDLPIWEPGAPTVCFEILPSNDGLVFKTSHPDIVLLNGAGVDSEVLRVGDTIRIMDTLIEVDFAE